MRPATRRLLRRAALAYPCVVLSGRARADAARRVRGAPVADVIGNHGMERGRAPASAVREVRRWTRRLEERLGRTPGVAIEDKGVSLAVHYRGSRQKKRVRERILEAAGSLGDVATFSFFPSKNLFCLGDGGAIATDRDEVAERARMLRFHGSRDKRTFTEVGWNSRLDALQAAVLRVGLSRLDDWSRGRRELAAAYEQEGAAELVDVPRPRDGEEPAWHLYVVRTAEPDAVAAALSKEGVAARSYYRVPVHRQPAMAAWRPADELPGTESAARTNLALPMGPTLGHAAAAVTTALRAVRA